MNLISRRIMVKPVVGKDIDSWCTRCKLMLAHTIESIRNGKIAKVHCNTCKAQHVYRPNPPGKSTRKRSATVTSKEVDSNFESLMRGKDPSKARRYALSERFAVNELLRHPQFGLGIVRITKDFDKIEVVFADSVRTLVHGRSS